MTGILSSLPLQRRLARPNAVTRFIAKNQSSLSTFQAAAPPPEPAEEEVLHQENEWGISVVNDDDEDQNTDNTPASSSSAGLELVEGVSVAYEKAEKVMEAEDVEKDEDEDNGQSLEELMKQMKGL